MKKNKFIIAIIILIVIFVGIFVYYQKSKKESLNDNSLVVSESIIGSYVGHLAKDIYTLTITSEKDGVVEGKLDIRNFEKDSSTGAIKGTYKDGILLADYNFLSEGVWSINQVIFKKVEGGFLRGYGKPDDATGTRFVDLSKITYDPSVVYEFTTNEVINSVVFNCLENKSIQTKFFKDSVDLSLSDGRKIILPQVISASGARYANYDESFVFWNKGGTAFINEKDQTTYKECSMTPVALINNETTTGMANPASVNCEKLGGSLKIEKRGDGGEYGLCYFEDNRACEEWALMKGDCPVGGMKTTGFNTIDQKYCAWSGGQTFSVPNSICVFKNGSECSTLDFYNGKCLPNT